jgi:hypothetical protein
MVTNMSVYIECDTAQFELTDRGIEAAALGLEFDPSFLRVNGNPTEEEIKEAYEMMSAAVRSRELVGTAIKCLYPCLDEIRCEKVIY